MLKYHHPRMCEDCPQQPQDCVECQNNPHLFVEINTGPSEIERMAMAVIPKHVTAIMEDE